MKVLTTTKNYEIAVAITAVKLILNDFVRWGMQAAVIYDYPDMKGLAAFEELAEEDVILLKRAKNPRSSLLLNYATIIHDLLSSYLNLFAPTLQNAVVSKDICSFANELYFRLIYDNPMYCTDDLDIDLELFAYSVMHAMYCLCELVITGSVDLDSAFDHGSSYDLVMEGTWDAYLNHEDHDFRLLANLMETAVGFYEEVVEVLIGNN
ncbi:hypothetical protein OQY15_04530 [Pedobacter sp. MC2016-15]|uniref:hypothetical protein n=1 Tax=Pedobacter sp. MC2016-15 TaxID=2994473 RepID=UPI002247C8C1|nr:hypothetical protein [Pedobacter sp. MC2016-15]MCX2478343.1 hypothetical protein [Pedobacter sp. MC2016-15]